MRTETFAKHPVKTKFHRKAGLAPGTLTYVGDAPDFPVRAYRISFHEDHLVEEEIPDIFQLREEPDFQGVHWIHIVGVHKTEIIESIGNVFSLHPLVLEDIVHTEQRAKLDFYEDYIYVVLKMIRAAKHHEIVSEQLSLVLKGNTLISFIEDEGDVFDAVRERIRKGNNKFRRAGSDYLLYSLLDVIVDHYFLVLESIGDKLEETEERMLRAPGKSDLQLLHRLKRELMFLRKAVWPLREVLGSLSKSDEIESRGNTAIYLRDVYDHCVHTIDTIETYRDLTSGLMEIHLSSISNKMNRVMKTLTIIATIFIPLTFIVGVYGMNFKYMPELEIWWAYPAVWVLMIGVTIGMLIYFRRKDYF